MTHSNTTQDEAFNSDENEINNIIRINDINDADTDEAEDYDFDYDPNEMYFALNKKD